MPIRPYQPTDKPALLAIFRQLTPTYFAEAELADYEGYLDTYGHEYFVTETAGNVLGGHGYRLAEQGREGHITWLFFDPAHRRKGLGTEAVRSYLHRFTETPTVKKAIANTSQHAYRFFEKLGFGVIRIETDYWADGIDLYAMEMNLLDV